MGYVSAFSTYSQAAGRWEVDELAVHPQAQGRGIGTALVARALEVGAQQIDLCEARALVAVDNLASRRVFLKNGFRAADTVHLLAYRANGRVPRSPRPGAPVVRPAQPDADLGKVDAQALDHVDYVALSRDNPTGVLIAEHLARLGVCVDEVVSTDSLETVRKMVESGIGVLMSTTAMRTDTSTAAIRTHHPPRTRSATLNALRRRRPSPAGPRPACGRRRSG